MCACHCFSFVVCLFVCFQLSTGYIMCTIEWRFLNTSQKACAISPLQPVCRATTMQYH